VIPVLADMRFVRHDRLMARIFDLILLFVPVPEAAAQAVTNLDGHVKSAIWEAVILNTGQALIFIGNTTTKNSAIRGTVVRLP
jgi:hypothetical protein